MAHGNKYWSANQQAFVPESSVAASATTKWTSNGGMRANSIRMLNGAFEAWFLLRNSINSCEDANHRAMMIQELEDAGDAGFGFGVQDLDDAFEHWLKPGLWTDDNWANYTRVNGIFGSGKPSLKNAQYCWGLQTNLMVGPAFAVHFFNAIDNKLDNVKSSIAGHNGEVAKLAAAIAQKDGQKTSDSFHSIAKYAGKAKKLMFLAPSMNEKYAYYGNSIELKGGGSTGVLAGKGVKTFLSAVDDLDKFLQVHDAALRTGIFDNRTSTAFAALTIALGKVPVLGGFYAQMVENLPGFFANFQALNEEYYKNIDRTVRDAVNY